MALATLADVKRVLRIPSTDVSDTERDTQLTEALAMAESWYDSHGGMAFDVSGAQTETYFNVAENGSLPLPVFNVPVTEVKVFPSTGSTGTVLPATGYDVLFDSVRLRPDLSFTPFENATARRTPGEYNKVTVVWTGPNSVPKDVRDGIAYLAAGVWKSGPRLLAGLTSEKIGDYSYDVNPDASGIEHGQVIDFVGLSLMFLRTHMQYRRRVSVT